jgi:glutathione peroxidase
MKIVALIIMILTTTQAMSQDSIHDFNIQELNSEEVINFESFKGKKILIVNVASKCGFTYQYEGLEELYQTYKDKLVVIGFPCNQFLGQEPGSEEKIATFCSTKYGVTFPMTEKIKVKGKEAHPIYKWLTSKELNGLDNYKISWNFNKFLLDENGQILAHFGSKVKPMDEAITSYLAD